jgi:hypothetical protein
MEETPLHSELPPEQPGGGDLPEEPVPAIFVVAGHLLSDLMEHRAEEISNDRVIYVLSLLMGWASRLEAENRALRAMRE